MVEENAVLLITHTLKCHGCHKHLSTDNFSKSAKRIWKNGNSTYKCFSCEASHNRHRQLKKNINKYGLFECVVCGSKFETEKGTDIFRIKRKYSSRCVCSTKCLTLYDKAVQYVKEVHNITDHNIAKNVVINTWFTLRLKKHAKDIRLQKGNA